MEMIQNQKFNHNAVSNNENSSNFSINANHSAANKCKENILQVVGVSQSKESLKIKQ
jgi:hypothetical protein